MKNKELLFIPFALGVFALVRSTVKGSGARVAVWYETRRRGAYDKRPLDQIRGAIIHHTATAGTATPDEIAAIHTDEKEWPGIAYGFLIYPDGTVYQTNLLGSASYHSRGNNTDRVGIAFVGDFTTVPPTDRALGACLRLLKSLKNRPDLPNFRLLSGHREKRPTACPGDSFPLESLRRKSGLSAG